MKPHLAQYSMYWWTSNIVVMHISDMHSNLNVVFTLIKMIVF